MRFETTVLPRGNVHSQNKNRTPLIDPVRLLNMLGENALLCNTFFLFTFCYTFSGSCLQHRQVWRNQGTHNWHAGELQL